MAIAIDQSSIGTGTASGSATSLAFNTTTTVASNGFIVVVVWMWSSGSLHTTMSGGGLTWTLDKQGHSLGPTNPNVGFYSAQAPSGLASGTTITANFNASVPGRGMGGTSFTGVATSSALDVAGAVTGATGTAAWATPSTSILAGSVLIGVSYDENASSGSTVTGPSIEALDFGQATEHRQTLCYRIESSAGSYTVAGTWAASANSNTLGIAYKTAAATDASTTSRTFSPIPLIR